VSRVVATFNFSIDTMETLHVRKSWSSSYYRCSVALVMVALAGILGVSPVAACAEKEATESDWQGPYVPLEDRPLTLETAAVLQRRFIRCLDTMQKLSHERPEHPFAPLCRYLCEYADACNGCAHAESVDALVEVVSKRKLLLLGDDHYSDVCAKHHMLLLRQLAAKKSRIVVGLEFLTEAHSADIQSFLQHKLSVREFANRIAGEHISNFHNDPRAPWMNFVEFLRDEKFEITWMEKHPDEEVALRDLDSTERTRQLLNEIKQDELLCVVFGSAHFLGAGHMGEKIEEPKTTVVASAPLQEFELANQGKRTDVPFKLKKDVYLFPCRGSKGMEIFIAGNEFLVFGDDR
jgi:hypothetical protein